jgi:hypothetical protein
MKTRPIVDPEVAPIVGAVLTGIMADIKHNNDLMQHLQYSIGFEDGRRQGYREGVEAAQAQMREAAGFVRPR